VCGVLAAMGVLLPGNDIAASALIPLIDTKNKIVKTTVKNVNKLTVKNGEKPAVKISSELVGDVVEAVSNGAVSCVATLTVSDVLSDDSVGVNGTGRDTDGDALGLNGTTVHDNAVSTAVTVEKSSSNSDGSGVATSGVSVTEECATVTARDSGEKEKENGCSAINTEAVGMEIEVNMDNTADSDHNHDVGSHTNGNNLNTTTGISDAEAAAEPKDTSMNMTVTFEDNSNGIASDDGDKVVSDMAAVIPEITIEKIEMKIKSQENGDQLQAEKYEKGAISVLLKDSDVCSIVKIETDNGREIEVEKEVEFKDENETESDTDDGDTLDLQPNEGVLEFLERRWGDLLQNYLKEEELRSKLRILQENIAAAAAQANICAPSFPPTSSSSFGAVNSSFPLSINTDLGNGIEKYGDGIQDGNNPHTDLSLDYSGYSPSNMSTSLFLFGSEELEDSYPVSPALLLSPTVAMSIAKAHATMSNSQFFPETDSSAAEASSKGDISDTIENQENNEIEITSENNGSKGSSSLTGNDNVIVNEESNTSDENFSILMQSSLADDFSPEYQDMPKQGITTFPNSPANGISGGNGDFEGVFSSNPGSSYFELNNSGNSSAEMKIENDDSYNDAIMNFLSGDNAAAGDASCGSTGVTPSAPLSGLVSLSGNGAVSSVGNVDTAAISDATCTNNNNSINSGNNSNANINNDNNNSSSSSSSSRAGSKSTAKRTSNQRLWKINPYLFPSQTQLLAFSDHENDKSTEGDNAAVVSCSKITVKSETDYSAELETINDEITDGNNDAKAKSPLPIAKLSEVNMNGTTTLQKLFEIDTENLNRETNIVTCESINNLNTMKNVKINNILKNNHKAEPSYGKKISSRSSKELKILLSDPEKVLSAWMHASHEEVCALELEESIIRR
jgi:hypothetical protein